MLSVNIMEITMDKVMNNSYDQKGRNTKEGL